MKFTELKLQGAFLIEIEPFSDERGTFSRQFCKKELSDVGISFEICQCNLSFNNKKGTLRGMHFQKAPYLEAKIISCMRGSFFDVIVDLRKDSNTYLKWEAVELSYGNNMMLYIPPNFAHGFQTLADNTIVYYHLDAFFNSEYYDGIRYNDPKIGINWPISDLIINERDSEYILL